MNSERRSNDRYLFEVAPEGELRLSVDGKQVAILELQDVSPFGVGLLVASPVASGSRVQLQYHHGEVDVTVLGEVVWHSQSDSEFRIGVYLNAEDAAHNVILFNAITSSSEQ